MPASAQGVHKNRSTPRGLNLCDPCYLRRRLASEIALTSRCHAVCVSAEPRRWYCTPLRVPLVSVVIYSDTHAVTLLLYDINLTCSHFTGGKLKARMNSTYENLLLQFCKIRVNL